MVQAQQAPQSKTLKERWNNLSDHAKRFWSAMTVVAGAIGSGVAAYVFLTPQIEIRPGVIESDKDASQVEFVVKNVGHFEISEALFHCKILTGTSVIDTGANFVAGPDRAPMGQFIKNLKPGDEATRNCWAGFTVPYPVTYDVGITFDWPFWWKKITSTRHFISIKGRDGHMNVQPDSN